MNLESLSKVHDFCQLIICQIRDESVAIKKLYQVQEGLSAGNFIEEQLNFSVLRQLNLRNLLNEIWYLIRSYHRLQGHVLVDIDRNLSL